MEIIHSSVKFAVEAEELLLNGNASAALDLCKSGISVFPDYPMGWRILAETYFELNDLDNALQSVEQGLLKFPKYLPLSEFERIIEETAIIREVTEDFKEQEIVPKLADELHQSKDETIIDESDIPEPLLSSGAEEIQQVEHNKPEQTNFLRLVNNMESQDISENQLRADNPALIPGLSFTPLRATRRTHSNDFQNQPPRFPDMYNPVEEIADDTDDLPTDETIYATDTMAGILESQGAYAEAIKIYTDLSETNPDRADYYNKKIEELNKKLND